MNKLNNKYELLNYGVEREKKLRRKILEKMVDAESATVDIYKDVYNEVFSKNENLVNELVASLSLDDTFVNFAFYKNDSNFLSEMVNDAYVREYGGVDVNEFAVSNVVHSIKGDYDMILLEMAVKYLKEHNVSKNDKNKLLDSLATFFTNSDSVRCYLAGDDIGAIMHTTVSVPTFVDNKKASMIYTDMMLEDGKRDSSLFGTLLIASAIEVKRRNDIDINEFLESENPRIKSACDIVADYVNTLQKEKTKTLVKVN